MGRANWKTQFTLLPSASAFHNKVRELILKDPILNNMKCYQEVSVAELIDGYQFRNHHFDWYIDELATVVELHGAQHYEMVNFGNIAYDAAVDRFRGIKKRDQMKKTAALEAGLNYVEIDYKKYKKLNGELLRELILSGSLDD